MHAPIDGGIIAVGNGQAGWRNHHQKSVVAVAESPVEGTASWLGSRLVIAPRNVILQDLAG